MKISFRLLAGGALTALFGSNVYAQTSSPLAEPTAANALAVATLSAMTHEQGAVPDAHSRAQPVSYMVKLQENGKTTEQYRLMGRTGMPLVINSSTDEGAVTACEFHNYAALTTLSAKLSTGDTTEVVIIPAPRDDGRVDTLVSATFAHGDRSGVAVVDGCVFTKGRADSMSINDEAILAPGASHTIALGAGRSLVITRVPLDITPSKS